MPENGRPRITVTIRNVDARLWQAIKVHCAKKGLTVYQFAIEALEEKLYEE